MHVRRLKVVPLAGPPGLANAMLVGTLVLRLMIAHNVIKAGGSVSEQQTTSLHLQHSYMEYARLMAPLVLPQLYPACGPRSQTLIITISLSGDIVVVLVESYKACRSRSLGPGARGRYHANMLPLEAISPHRKCTAYVQTN